MYIAGSYVQLEGSAIRLSLIPWLLSLVLPLMVVVENGGKVTGFVVLTKICFQIVPVPAIFRLCGTTHSFPRFRKIIRVGFVDEVTTMSVIVVPIAIGTLC